MIAALLSLPIADAFTVWGQTFEAKDLVIVGLLIVLEGVLSIDNALVLGLLAKRLPKSQQARALSYGLIGAFVFRFVAIGTATFLLKWTTAKLLGGAYLLYIALKHLVFEGHEKQPDTVVVDAEGEPQLVDATTGQPLSPERQELEIEERVPFDLTESLPPRAINDANGTAAPTRGPTPGPTPTPTSAPTSAPTPTIRAAAPHISMRDFWWTVFVIEMTDIAFAVDSILAAIGVVGSPPPGTPADAWHPKLWVVILGGFLGVIVMRFAAALFIRLLEAFPRFETAAYLLVCVIGLKLVADWGLNSDWSSYGWKGNQVWAEQYQDWLRSHWIWPPPERADHAAEGHVPHLLDFHDLRRPECLLFWASMLAAFLFGFIPRKGDKDRSRAPSS